MEPKLPWSLPWSTPPECATLDVSRDPAWCSGEAEEGKEHCRVNKNTPAACGKDAAGPILVRKPEWDTQGAGGWELSEEFLPTPGGKKKSPRTWKKHVLSHVFEMSVLVLSSFLFSLECIGMCLGAGQQNHAQEVTVAGRGIGMERGKGKVLQARLDAWELSRPHTHRNYFGINNFLNSLKSWIKCFLIVCVHLSVKFCS